MLKHSKELYFKPKSRFLCFFRGLSFKLYFFTKIARKGKDAWDVTAYNST